MFAPPRQLTTEIFARVPDALRKPGQLSAERIAAGKGSHETHSQIEGPVFDAQGRLWIVDIAFGRIFRIDAAGDMEVVAEYEGEPNGLTFDAQGDLLIADHQRGLLLRDAGTGRIRTLHSRFRTEGFKGLNDLFRDPSGNLWFTDQGQSGLQDWSGRVYRMSPDGHLTCELDNVPSPNGIAMNPAGTSLYVAATRGNAVWRAMVLPDGALTRVGLFLQLSGGTGPDGLAVDAQGNLFVAHMGLGSVWKFSPSGEPLLRIVSCTGASTSNIALSPDERQLYITESETGTVLVAQLDKG
ncbi:SMP-30/gluconolactonase/LRE family protein [Hydrogenophaga sp. BPS33]|uniref:SMP-30/gluconolactonase/LRE family protein n=1 Tax=Hydrogenophaga sp. BPS33 TaxID=2651974 RepID=UPI00131FF9B6|nr:SMP-30/gluconolactonase/LRE family protein [Hydrogenophaga sp. BPS33]QHE83714.1 SMP-30/gluconolactonase/LRE family protein [Hydrogenophaga sp. BPS33]